MSKIYILCKALGVYIFTMLPTAGTLLWYCAKAVLRIRTQFVHKMAN